MEEEECLPQEESAWADELDVDISQLCRICANPNEYLIPIFHGEGKEHELEEKISKHLPIKVAESDTLPTNLCYQCASTLIAWHDMVVGCIEADDKLKSVSGKDTKTTDEITKNDTEVEQDSNSQQASVPEMQINNAAYILQEQEPELTSSVNEENVIEEIIPADKFDVIEDKTADSRSVRMEEQMEYSDNDLQDELLSDRESDEEYGTLYNCSICKASNMALKDFLAHSKRHTKEEKQTALNEIVNYKILKEQAAKSSAATLGFRVQESLESSVTLYQCIVCGQGNLMLKQVALHSALHPHYLESHFCSICQKQFPDQNSLDCHFEMHLDNHDLICEYCNRRFGMINEVEAHEDSHFLAEYICADCRESFRSKELVLVHLKETHLNDSICLICDVELKSSRVIDNHFISHVTVRAVKRLSPGFFCDLCGKKYDSKVALQRHRIFLHNDRLPFICEHCGFYAYHETPLKIHLGKVHGGNEDGYVCFKCGNITNDKDKIVAPLVDKVCKLCGLEFKDKVVFTNHLKLHGEVKSVESFPKVNLQQTSKRDLPLACSLCGDVFTTNDFCLAHSLCHVNSTFCDLCDKPFRSETALTFHLNEIHVSQSLKIDKERTIFPFKCKDCTLAFRLEFELEDHCETHKDIQYQCHHCFSEFSTDGELQDHLGSHKEEIM
ncbi:zinc finger protein 624-like isoform X1 [Macrosteles quadrilineatus]|uniref:zinc finger protein 624-like isoform X1 n=1 Tax=Macrosteles quadrilineatus TaxID=74068 RepID=UPI0023E13EA6|nr:zinc finger protein 624-like isoform X1 [Macrosteles quadrilineatus]XP_054272711.1 zinc finger protein 624-like isoform X1 [Macrosteles quadrilineatus]